jgi:L-ascorbate metabolism protein UlaG (beta-lactamase superfamily)
VWGVAGRQVTPRYWERILRRLDPRIVVPTHYDDFFSPLGRRTDFVRSVDLAAVPDEIARVSGDARVAALPRVDQRQGGTGSSASGSASAVGQAPT